MGWTDLTSGNFDWQDKDFVNEYLAAIRERLTAVGLSTSGWSDITAGTDIQDHSFWADIQTEVNTLCPYYVNIDEKTNGDFDGYSDTSIPNWTSNDLWASVTGNSGGPRRYTTHPDDGGSASYGTMQPGDIIGPWIFEDLQAALNKLIWSQFTTSAVTTGSEEWYGHGADTSWTSAKTAAESDYQKLGTGYVPRIYTEGVEGFGDFNAYVHAVKSKLEVTGLPTTINYDINVYLYAGNPAISPDSWTFDAYGVSGLTTASAMNKVDSAAGQTSATYTTPMIGSVTLPSPWVSEPGTGETYVRGFEGQHQTAVAHFDVTGGFSYTE